MRRLGITSNSRRRCRIAVPALALIVALSGATARGVTAAATNAPAIEADAPTPELAVEVPELPVLDDGRRLESENLAPIPKPVPQSRTRDYQADLELAKNQRAQKGFAQAEKILGTLMTTNAPPDIHRQAMLELAFVAQDQGRLTRAVQVLSQYVQRFPDHPTVPEIYLRQGLIYRELGANQVAVGRFYLVMSSSLQLKLDQMAYYQRLVLQAQTEIADTVFLDANYEEAARLYQRMLKQEAPELNRPHVHFKLIRCLAALDRKSETTAEGESYIGKHPDSENVPEIRFLLAGIYKEQGRNGDATRHVIGLLENQDALREKDPERWAYWQQRAGNDLANRFYRDGDHVNALLIYEAMAKVNNDPSWQLPVLYQIGLVHERLQQSAKATAAYDRILELGKGLDGTSAAPALKSVLEMARWRKDHLAWLEKSAIERELLRPPGPAGNAAAAL